MTMFIPRAQGVFDQTAGRTIAAADLETIAERQAYLRLVHKEQSRLAGAAVLAPWASTNLMGGVLWLREIGFAKLALLDRGAPLIDHWNAIKRERDIPVETLAWEIAESEYSRRALNWGSTLYRHVMASQQDRTTLALNGGYWVFRSIPNLPGFSTVPSQEALHFYGEIGGDIPSFHHIQVLPPARAITMVGGGTYTVQYQAEGGEPPIVWSIAGPEWMNISDTGLVTLTPPELPAGTLGSRESYAAIIAKGLQEVEGHASLNVEVLPIVG